jgi:hypothetical protein
MMYEVHGMNDLNCGILSSESYRNMMFDTTVQMLLHV